LRCCFSIRRPALFRYFFAYGFRIAGCSGAVVLAALVAWNCEAFSVWSIIAVILALPLGLILGQLCLWPPLFWVGSLVNGSPFHEGDTVRVLVGPNRNRVGQIYEIWKSRNQVRVQLDERAEKDVTDVFMYNEVCREKNVERG